MPLPKELKYSSIASLEGHFWTKVKTVGVSSDDCWEWSGVKDPQGYGTYTRQGVVHTKAHRVAYSLHHKSDLPGGLYVCHECDNPSCCNPSHLFLGTPKENQEDMTKKGRGRFGSRAGSTKFHEKQVAEILLRIEQGESQIDLAKEYEVSLPTIARIAQGKTWQHVDRPKLEVSKRKVGNRKLTPEQVREIRQLSTQGFSQQKIADRFGVDRKNIGHILSGFTWSDVT